MISPEVAGQLFHAGLEFMMAKGLGFRALNPKP